LRVATSAPAADRGYDEELSKVASVPQVRTAPVQLGVRMKPQGNDFFVRQLG
jgi:hypothetical protein